MTSYGSTLTAGGKSHHLNWKVTVFVFLFSITTSVTSKPKAQSSSNSSKLDSYEFALPPHSHLFFSWVISLFMERIREARKGFKYCSVTTFSSLPQKHWLSVFFHSHFSSSQNFLLTFILCSIPSALHSLL